MNTLTATHPCWDFSGNNNMEEIDRQLVNSMGISHPHRQHRGSGMDAIGRQRMAEKATLMGTGLHVPTPGSGEQHSEKEPGGDYSDESICANSTLTKRQRLAEHSPQTAVDERYPAAEALRRMCTDDLLALSSVRAPPPVVALVLGHIISAVLLPKCETGRNGVALPALWSVCLGILRATSEKFVRKLGTFNAWSCEDWRRDQLFFLVNHPRLATSGTAFTEALDDTRYACVRQVLGWAQCAVGTEAFKPSTFLNPPSSKHIAGHHTSSVRILAKMHRSKTAELFPGRNTRSTSFKFPAELNYDSCSKSSDEKSTSSEDDTNDGCDRCSPRTSIKLVGINRLLGSLNVSKQRRVSPREEARQNGRSCPREQKGTNPSSFSIRSGMKYLSNRRSLDSGSSDQLRSRLPEQRIMTPSMFSISSGLKAREQFQPRESKISERKAEDFGNEISDHRKSRRKPPSVPPPAHFNFKSPGRDST
jgi:hypothetical protein